MRRYIRVIPPGSALKSAKIFFSKQALQQSSLPLAFSVLVLQPFIDQFRRLPIAEIPDAVHARHQPDLLFAEPFQTIAQPLPVVIGQHRLTKAWTHHHPPINRSRMPFLAMVRCIAKVLAECWRHILKTHWRPGTGFKPVDFISGLSHRSIGPDWPRTDTEDRTAPRNRCPPRAGSR
jgi:hypothetical protein